MIIAFCLCVATIALMFMFIVVGHLPSVNEHTCKHEIRAARKRTNDIWKNM